MSVPDYQAAKKIAIQAQAYSWLQQVYNRRPAVPLHQATKYIKDGLVRYCNTKASSNCVNNMWILKKSTSLLLSLEQLGIHTATSVQTLDFSIPYILNPTLKSTLLYD